MRRRWYSEFAGIRLSRNDLRRACDSSHWLTEAGVNDTTAFNRCISDGTYLGRIRDAAAAANKLGVTGTPTVLINNVRIGGTPSADHLRRLINAALAKKS